MLSPTNTSEVYNILRIEALPQVNQAVSLVLDTTTNHLRFDRIFALPGGACKFTIRRDAVTGLFVTLSNNVTDLSCPSMRCVLTLAVSSDLFHWRIIETLLTDDTGMEWADVLRYVGFHYVDWQFDGPDLLYAVRTSYRGANSYHNANRLTVKRVPNWRQLLNGE